MQLIQNCLTPCTMCSGFACASIWVRCSAAWVIVCLALLTLRTGKKLYTDAEFRDWARRALRIDGAPVTNLADVQFNQ